MELAPPVISVGAPRAYVAQGKPDRILAQLGLDGAGLARTVRAAQRASSEKLDGRPPKAPATSLPATLTARDMVD